MSKKIFEERLKIFKITPNEVWKKKQEKLSKEIESRKTKPFTPPSLK